MVTHLPIKSGMLCAVWWDVRRSNWSILMSFIYEKNLVFLKKQDLIQSGILDSGMLAREYCTKMSSLHYNLSSQIQKVRSCALLHNNTYAICGAHYISSMLLNLIPQGCDLESCFVFVFSLSRKNCLCALQAAIYCHP